MTGKVVLQDLSASVPQGASCVAGPSGSGKSTLLRLLNRLADPDSGVVRYEGANVRDRDPLELRQEVCLVPQLPALLEGSVEDNIRYAARLADRDPDVARLLDLAGLDASFAARSSDRLSVGEQQRAMLARALAMEPRVLLLDEPTSALDEDARGAVEATLLHLRERVKRLHRAGHPRPRPGPADGRLGGAPGRGAAGGGGPGDGAPNGLNSSSIHVSLGDVAATLALVGVAVAVSFWRRADLERDIGIAVVRSAIQLTAIGYVINFIFDQDSLWFVVALLAVMVVFGALQARSRAKRVPDAFWPLLLSLALAAAVTLGLVVALGVFKAQPRYLVPVGGMVVGNSMTAAAVTLNRLGDEVSAHARELEATLALGATSTQAAAPLVRRSLRSGMITLDRLHQDHGADLLPGHDGGHAARGRRPHGRRPPPVDPPVDTARQRCARGADRGHAGLSQLLHPGPPASRPTRAVETRAAASIVRPPITHATSSASPPGVRCIDDHGA